MSPIRKKTSSLPTLQIALASVMVIAVIIALVTMLAPSKPPPPPPSVYVSTEERPESRREPRQAQASEAVTWASEPTGAETAVQPVTPAEEMPAGEMTLTITGRVLDTRTQQGIPNAGVAAFLTGDGAPATPRRQRPRAAATARTNEQGEFQLKLARPGNYRVEAAAAEYAMATAEAGLLDAARTSAQVTLELSTGASIAGRVTEEGSSLPISGLLVTTSDHRHQANTDENGQYQLRGLSMGEVEISVDLANTSFKAAKTLPYQKVRITSPDEEVRNVDFTLEPAGVVWGYVITPDNQPIPATEVVLSTSESILSQALSRMVDQVPPLRGRSEEDGYYELVGIPLNEEWRLYANSDRFSPQLADPFLLTASHRTARIDIYLFSGTTISGVVVDKRNAPVPQAEVVCIPSYSNMVAPLDAPHAFRHGRSDANGQFEVKEVPAGDYQIMARKQGFKVAMVGEPVYPDGYNNIPGVKLVLEPVDSGDHAIFGRVTDTSGAFIASAEVRLEGTSSSMSSVERTESTNGQGEFRFDGVEAGSYGLIVSKEGFAPRRVGRVALNRATNVFLDASALVRGRVIVKETNAPPPQYTVSALPLADSGGGQINLMRYLNERVSNTFNNPDGAFELYLPAGEYKLQATAPDLTPGEEFIVLEPGQVEEGIELVLSREGGVIEGRVVARDGGNPQGAEVYLVPANSPAEAMLMLAGGEETGVRTTRVGADGEFVFEQLTAGNYVVIVRHASYASAQSDVIPLQENGQQRNITVELGSGGVLEGYVYRNNRIAPSVTVMVLGHGESLSATTDHNGFYRIDGLATGQYQAMVMSGGLGGIVGNPLDTEGVPVDIIDGETTRHDFGAGTGTRIEGACIPPPPPGLLSGAVVLRPPGFGMTPIGGTVGIDSLTQGHFRALDGSGIFELNDVPPGEWQLDVYFVEPGNMFELRYVHAELVMVSGEEEVIQVELMVQGY